METTSTYCRPCDVHHDSHGIFRSLSPECPLVDYLPNDFEVRPVANESDVIFLSVAGVVLTFVLFALILAIFS